jgi:uncharacterized protein (DUF2147 family)
VPTERQPAPVAAERQPAPVAAEPESDPSSPIGTWATEENKGNVRIEQCGDNLCGYAAKSGEKVLINMKPQGSKWAGRAHDPDSGRKYDSTMTMKGNNTLRVQGCGFGGMFCGNQTWKRVS